MIPEIASIETTAHNTEQNELNARSQEALEEPPLQLACFC